MRKIKLLHICNYSKANCKTELFIPAIINQAFAKGQTIWYQFWNGAGLGWRLWSGDCCNRSNRMHRFISFKAIKNANLWQITLSCQPCSISTMLEVFLVIVFVYFYFSMIPYRALFFLLRRLLDNSKLLMLPYLTFDFAPCKLLKVLGSLLNSKGFIFLRVTSLLQVISEY